MFDVGFVVQDKILYYASSEADTADRLVRILETFYRKLVFKYQMLSV